jgi:phage tail sheath protein FI
MAFVATGKAPGVYIDEVQVPGPIAGAPTSIAAFVGPAQMGPLLQPTLLTNANQFGQVFGSYIEDPMRVYVTHAVNGFFNEGGGQCWFVRIGTGVQASLNLKDRSNAGNTTLVATAIKEGAGGNNITAQVDNASIAQTTATRQQVQLTAVVNKGQNQATIAKADAQKFNQGDSVLIEDGGTSELATIATIATNGNATITFAANLVNNYTAAGDIRTPDLTPGQQRIQVGSVTSIQVGTYVNISQQGGASEQGVVRSVDTIGKAITLTNGLVNTYPQDAAHQAVAIATVEFTLTINWPNKTGKEVFANLSMDPRHSQYFAKIVNSQAVTVALADPPSPAPPAGNVPVALAATNLTNGVSDDITKITTKNYHDGIDTLLRIPEANLLCVPDVAAKGFSVNKADTQDVQQYMIAHCEKVLNRFAILDPAWEDTTKAFDPSIITAQRNNLSSERGMGSLYYPWIAISNPLGSGRIGVPASGHMAGVYANNDNTRGVFKAPANEQIVSALDLSRNLTDDEQGPLNDLGIDVIRSFPAHGVVVWGARTVAPPDVTQWRYNSIRRFVNFVEASLRDGTRFAVFEPNNPTLWGTVKRLVTDFLNSQWQLGALEGATAKDAFNVVVDSTNNTPQSIALGQLIIQVTLYTVPPAEYVVFQIIQEPGGSSVSE